MASGGGSKAQQHGLAEGALNLHMYGQIFYQNHYVSVYESRSNEAVKSGGTLKFFHAPLMYPTINAEEKEWIWLDDSHTQLIVSLATSNDEIIKLIGDYVNKDATKKGYYFNIAPMVITSLTAAIISTDGEPIAGIRPIRFLNPSQVVLVFRFLCTSAEQGEAALRKIIKGNYNIELSFLYAGVHTLSMNMIKITGETLRTVANSTTADGGNPNAQFIHRKQANKFVASYMANVEKTIYTENPNAETQLMIQGLEDQFKTLMQQGDE